MVKQVKYMSQKAFFSLSDDIKLQMHNHQFEIESDITEILLWAETEIKNPYFVERMDGMTEIWILFVDELDATVFKLRWL